MKITFLIGGIYDILLGIPMLILPDFTTTVLNITKPKPIILFQISGVFLIIIGYFLLIASQDAQRLAFIGAGSIVIRLGYAILAVLTWLTIGIEMWYLLVAITDTITAIILLVPISLTEGISLKRLWQL